MAIDTETKRRAAVSVIGPFIPVLPNPDGTIDALDRALLAHVYLPETQAQTIAVDQASESDLAQGLGIIVGQIAESDYAQAVWLPGGLGIIGYTEEGYLVFDSGHDEIGRLVIDPINHLLDDGTMYVPAIANAFLVAQASENDAAQNIGPNAHIVSVGQASESEIAQPIEIPGIAIGQSAEIDAVQQIWAPASAVIIGYTEEGYLVFASGHDEIGRLVIDSLIHLLDDGTVFFPSILEGQAVGVGQTSETDSAQTIILNPQRQLVATALESDAAQTISTGQVVAVAQVQETDSAQAVGRRVLVAAALETDTAQAVAHLGAQYIAIGAALETDSAQTLLAVGPQVIAVGSSSESDSAVAMAAQGGLVQQDFKFAVLDPAFTFRALTSDYRLVQARSRFELESFVSPYEISETTDPFFYLKKAA